MTINRAKDGKLWLERFESDTHVSNTVTPGFARKIGDLGNPKKSGRNETHWMCSTSAGKIIEELFGKSDGTVEGKSGRAKFYVFDYNGRIIAAKSEGHGIGTSWHAFTGEEGSRYGQYVLISCDKECKDYWSAFCEELALLKTALEEKTGNTPKP